MVPGGPSRVRATTQPDVKVSDTVSPAITASHVYKVFGRRPARGVRALEQGKSRDDLRKDGLTAAVIDASFEVQPGEIFVVMGLSGSGKSTLLRTVNGLNPATAGRVEVQGKDLSQLSDRELRDVRRDDVSMVFQHFALLPHRTVGENAAYGLEIRGMNRTERRERAERALGMVGLEGWGRSMPGELSGGMQQRVGLARALAAETPILLMDEAFSALDPLIRREMQDQLIDLQERLGKTILFITHDLNEAMRLGHRIAMMRDGEIVQIGTNEEILHAPANDYVAQFVQDVDRSRVLTARQIMEGGDAPAGAPTVPPGALVADLVEIVADTDGPVAVVDGDRPLGVVSRGRLLRALAAHGAQDTGTEVSA